MKYLLYLILLIPLNSFSQASSGDWKGILVTNAATVRFQNEPPAKYAWMENYLYTEYIWHLKVTKLFPKNIAAGIDNKIIFTNSQVSELNNYWMGGLFAQYNIAPSSVHRVYFQGSYSVGDYCPCGEEGVVKEFVNFLGVGGGVNFAIFPTVYLNLGIEDHFLLNKVEYWDMFFLYTVGIDIHFSATTKNPHPH